MKSTLLTRKRSFRLLRCFVSFFLLTSVHAQSPIITIHSGLPRGVTTQVVYGNGIYLAGPYVTGFFGSSDGVSWAHLGGLDFGRSINLQPVVAYGSGLFVCVADSGKIFTSPDGAAWTRRNSGKSANLTDVEFVQGAFYVVGDSATLLHSTDGIVWDALSTGHGAPTDRYLGLAYGNGYLVITAANINVAGRVLYRSGFNTLDSWTADTFNIGKIKFLKDHFYGFGSDIYISSDAVNWTDISSTNPSFASSGNPTGGFYDGARIYLVGSPINFGNIHGQVYASTDGLLFDPPIATDLPATDGTYANNLRFIFSPYGMESSTDGVSYQPLGAAYNALASNGSNYVGVGGTNGHGLIFSSPDFSTWTDRTPAGIPEQGGVLYDGSRYVSTGGTIYASPDGIAWTRIGPTAQGGGRTTLVNSAAYGNGVYSGTNGDQLFISQDAATWFDIQDQELEQFSKEKIKFVNGYFFLVTASNAPDGSGLLISLFVSTTGNGWQNITPQLPFRVYDIDDILYDGSKYTIIGEELGTVDVGYPIGMFSVSTADINNPNSYGPKGVVTSPPPGSALRGSSFAYSNGYYVGFAADINTNNSMSYLVYSTDGFHWDYRSLGMNVGVGIGNIPNGNTFRLLSSSNVQITASFSTTLPTDSLIDFNARAIARSALLTWRINRDDKVDRVIIRRSSDGIHWDSIGSEAVVRHKFFERDYHFIDDNPLTGFNYYQLLLIGTDGSQRVSPVRRLFFGRREIHVYPNPAFGSCTVELPESGAGVLTLYSASGLRVLRQEFNGYSVTLSLRGLPRGLYHLSVTQNGKLYNKEILHL